MRITKRLSLITALALLLCFSLSSCVLGLTTADPASTYMTEEEVKQYINKTMNGNITVEGGDNYSITVNTSSEDTASAAKALLSAVSITCDFEAVYDNYPGVSSTEKRSSGSGVIYKLDKEHGEAYIITNYHVVYYENSKTANGISNDIKMYLYGQEGNEDEYGIDLEYVGGSMNYDIAILKTSSPSTLLAQSNAMAVEFADSDEVAVLDRAIAIGNPEALGISATLGHINVDSEYITMEGADGVTTIQIRVMRMDTPVNSGNSGGGLFDSQGRLIGIVNAKLTDSENMSYAIPSNFVRYVAENILYYCDGTSYQHVYRCYLGITVEMARLYTEYDIETGKIYRREDVSVKEVTSGSLADGLIMAGDIINSISVDGASYDVTRMYIVTDSMLNARVGSSVVINVTRDGADMDITIPITSDSLTAVK